MLVKCKFIDSDRLYTYQATGEYKTGDFAVVITPGNKPAIVQVKLLVENKKASDYDFEIKWLAQRVDLTEYYERVNQGNK